MRVQFFRRMTFVFIKSLSEPTCFFVVFCFVLRIQFRTCLAGRADRIFTQCGGIGRRGRRGARSGRNVVRERRADVLCEWKKFRKANIITLGAQPPNRPTNVPINHTFRSPNEAQDRIGGRSANEFRQDQRGGGRTKCQRTSQ